MSGLTECAAHLTFPRMNIAAWPHSWSRKPRFACKNRAFIVCGVLSRFSLCVHSHGIQPLNKAMNVQTRAVAFRPFFWLFSRITETMAKPTRLNVIPILYISADFTNEVHSNRACMMSHSLYSICPLEVLSCTWWSRLEVNRAFPPSLFLALVPDCTANTAYSFDKTDTTSAFLNSSNIQAKRNDVFSPCKKLRM